MRSAVKFLEIFLLAVLLLTGVASAVEPDEILQDPQLELRSRELTREIRCVVCQNQSIDDSDAPLARDMRLLVRKLVREGKSDEQVKAFLVERYGHFVLLRPPFQVETLMLWLSPVLFIGLGVWFLWRTVKGPTDALAGRPLSAEENEALEKLPSHNETQQ